MKDLNRVNWISFKTIIRKEVIRFLRIWPQTLLPSAITMTLYFIIFGNFIGSQIGEIQGFTYMQFIVPGLIMMAMITNSYSNVTSSFFGAKFQRNIEELLVSPTRPMTIILGFVLAGVLRGFLVGIVVLIVASFFTDLVVQNALLLIGFAFVTCFLFSTIGLLNGMFAKKFDDVSIVPTFILTPLIYLGGVFYSIAALPEIWQNVSRLNPILYMINGFRYSFIGISDINVLYAFSASVIFSVVLLIVTHSLLKKGVGLKN